MDNFCLFVLRRNFKSKRLSDAQKFPTNYRLVNEKLLSGILQLGKLRRDASKLLGFYYT